MIIVIEGKQIVATHGTKVLCSPPLTVGSDLSPCSHEEADTRMMVHVADAVRNGHKSIMIRTADTDVVVLAVAAVAALKRFGCPMGQEKATRSYPHMSLLRLLVHLNQGASLSSTP